MSTIVVEVCVDSRSPEYVTRSVKSAMEAGAKRIELCSDMHLDGLTPPEEHIKAARSAMGECRGLLCMIRPRGGDFFYSEDEIRVMEEQIAMAADSGADGIVLGVLNADQTIDEKALKRLTTIAKSKALSVTFHRAFDATGNHEAALERLLQHDVDRILTCGIGWEQKGTAVDGLPVLKKLLTRADRQLEIVVGGGLSKDNVVQIVSSLEPINSLMSFHLYSGVIENGEVSPKLVQMVYQNVCTPLIDHI